MNPRIETAIRQAVEREKPLPLGPNTGWEIRQRDLEFTSVSTSVRVKINGS